MRFIASICASTINRTSINFCPVTLRWLPIVRRTTTVSEYCMRLANAQSLRLTAAAAVGLGVQSTAAINSLRWHYETYERQRSGPAAALAVSDYSLFDQTPIRVACTLVSIYGPVDLALHCQPTAFSVPVYPVSYLYLHFKWLKSLLDLSRMKNSTRGDEIHPTISGSITSMCVE